MAVTAILDFYIFFSFLKVGTVTSAELRHSVKFYRNRSNRGRDIAIFGLFKIVAPVILDLNFF